MRSSSSLKVKAEPGAFSYRTCALLLLLPLVLFPCLAVDQKHESAIEFLGFELVCVFWLIQSV
uniref:Uncharacterized protein n=1 Tax=Fagus sylvatica TaxID=28930 RepID=A0A2N9HHG5_FAGSY